MYFYYTYKCISLDQLYRQIFFWKFHLLDEIIQVRVKFEAQKWTMKQWNEAMLIPEWKLLLPIIFYFNFIYFYFCWISQQTNALQYAVAIICLVRQIVTQVLLHIARIYGNYSYAFIRIYARPYVHYNYYVVSIQLLKDWGKTRGWYAY